MLEPLQDMENTRVCAAHHSTSLRHQEKTAIQLRQAPKKLSQNKRSENQVYFWAFHGLHQTLQTSRCRMVDRENRVSVICWWYTTYTCTCTYYSISSTWNGRAGLTALG
jgi:hypothetical protein